MTKFKITQSYYTKMDIKDAIALFLGCFISCRSTEKFMFALQHLKVRTLSTAYEPIVRSFFTGTVDTL